MTRFAVAAAALFLPGPAWGQYGAGVWVPRGPAVGVWTGAAFGFVPGAYQGFWSNGFSLYGPPVPTYGSIPGFFGGADQRLSNFPDLRYSTFGPWGWRGGFVPLDDPRPPLVLPVPPAVCVLRVPTADAELYVNGVRQDSSGVQRRLFAAVPPGRAVSYDLEIRWATPESLGTVRRTVILRAGERSSADFTSPAADQR
jgi:hypothetical protein